MESSANIPQHHHHHHPPLQDHQLNIVGSSSTTTIDLSGYAVASNAPAWTPNSILNNVGFGSATNTSILNSRNPRQQHHDDILVSSQNGSMITQDLMSFDWLNCTSGNNNFSNHQSLQHARIKREFSDTYTNFGEMISSPSSSIEDVVQVQQMQQPTSYRSKNYDQQRNDVNDPNAKNLLRTTLSSGGQNINGLHQSSILEATPKRGTFCQIYPTINVSNFINQTSLANSSSFDMNLQALDLLNSARFSGSFCQSMQDQLALSKNGLTNYGLYDYMKQSIQMPTLDPASNITPFSNGISEAKRSEIDLEPKAPQAAPKRSRSESRSSCPPFKVRKEKLGDRIAALQQLVAPFGKTDTASVLMEAIGYIKFLQNQVEGHVGINGNEETKGDLRSRGLCLVPMSCLSYVTESGGGVWPPPNFGSGT
ncbi:hypothetical protein ACH5RR_035165 [Cinchona calisaya]|uniref:BHLH domain-containing protein n=1 Tax=Cinchona calisaya TaxID=153742 RepID=A0ABD2YGA1_9GENT